MKTIQQGKSSDIDSMMLDCSLPGYPSVNLLPEIVSIETPVHLQVETPSSDLKEEYFPLWLSRYTQEMIGEGIRPVIELVRSGMMRIIEV